MLRERDVLRDAFAAAVDDDRDVIAGAGAGWMTPATWSHFVIRVPSIDDERVAGLAARRAFAPSDTASSFVSARSWRRSPATNSNANISTNAITKCTAGPGGRDEHAGEVALRAVRARLVFRRDVFEVRHADDAAVPAEDHGLDAVLGLAAL